MRRGNRVLRVLAIAGVVLLSISWGMAAHAGYEPDCTGPKVQPALYLGNPPETGLRIEAPRGAGSFEVVLGGLTYTVHYSVYDGDLYFKFWEQDGAPIVSQVIIKASDAHIYNYDPATHNDCNLRPPLNSGGQLAEISWVELAFTPPLLGSITVRKFDQTGAVGLSGATFELWRGSELLDTRLLVGSTHTWPDLVAGTYTVVETVPPPGYSLAVPASRLVTLESGSMDVVLDFANTPVTVLGSITVRKFDATGTVGLSGATFELWRGSELLDTRLLAGSTHTWPGLVAGTYTVVETVPPPGYNLAVPASRPVTLESGNMDVVLDFANTPATVLGSITVIKYLFDESTGGTSPLAGATFALYQPDLDGRKLDERTLDGSEYTWANLEPGTYTVVETAAPLRPDGSRHILAAPITVIVPAGENVRVEIYNDLPLTGMPYTMHFVSGFLLIACGLAIRSRRPYAGSPSPSRLHPRAMLRRHTVVRAAGSVDGGSCGPMRPPARIDLRRASVSGRWTSYDEGWRPFDARTDSAARPPRSAGGGSMPSSRNTFACSSVGRLVWSALPASVP